MKRLAFAALAGVFLATTTAASTAATPSDGVPSVLVRLTKLRRGSLPQIVTAYGTVQADAAARLTVMAPLAAVVDAVLVRQGEAIDRGAALIRLGPSPQTAAAYAQARSGVKAAEDAVRRTQALLGQHLATAQELATAQKSAADARATLAALIAQGAGGAQILRAPFDAVVTSLAVSLGSRVAEGAPLLDLARRGALVLVVGVVPAQAALIKTGDPAKVTPLGAREPADGKVVLRGAAVDPQTGLVPIQITLPSGELLSGETASADIVTAQVPGWVVPHAAILVDRQGATYVVQAAAGVAKKVAVRVLAADGGEDVIAGKLDAAAPLVLAGNYQLDNGMKIRTADPNGTPAR